jgi:hypothetical protein
LLEALWKRARSACFSHSIKLSVRLLAFQSKELSSVITERLKESEKTEEEINEMRNKYRPVAIRGGTAAIDKKYRGSALSSSALIDACLGCGLAECPLVDVSAQPSSTS